MKKIAILAPTFMLILVLGIFSSISAQNKFTSPGIKSYFNKSMRVMKKVPLSGPQQIRAANKHLKKMRKYSKHIRDLVEKAISERDMVKRNCLKKKLTAVEGIIKIAELSYVSLQESVAKNDRAAAKHEYGKINIAESKVEQFRTESEGCIGEIATYIGPVKLIVETDSAIMDDDPTPFKEPKPIIERPPSASPFR